jgi:DNA-binding CsgD family transcriptional regulator
MPLTRLDETELLTVLYDGLHETPRWSSFLNRLLRRAHADHASLIFGQGDTPTRRATQFQAGREGQCALPSSGALRPGRVYDFDELLEPAEPSNGTQAGRVVRVTEAGGTSAWLTITRQEGAFSAADSALMSSLAPHLTVLLRTFVTLERLRLRNMIGEDALLRAGVHWGALDGHGREIYNAGGRVAAGAEGIAVAPPATPTTAAIPPAEVRLRRAPPILGSATAAALRSQFGLSNSEARLAVRLANGMSLAEAAEELGLTLETARSYSKALFTKTATRGQPQLVRLVLTTPASLADPPPAADG